MEWAIKPIRSAGNDLYALTERLLGERPSMEHVLLVLFLGSGIYMYRGAAEFSPDAATFPRVMAGATAVLAALLLVRNYLRVLTAPAIVLTGLYVLYTGMTSVIDDGTGVPRILAGIIVVGAGIFLRGPLTDVVVSFVAEPMQVLGDEEAMQDSPEESDGEGGVAEDGDSDETTDETENQSDSGAMYVYEIDDPRGPVVTGLLCILYMVLTFTIGMLIATPVFGLGYALWARMWWPKAVSITALSLAIAYLFYWLISDDIAEGWYTGMEPWSPPPLGDVLEFAALTVSQLLEFGWLLGRMLESGAMVG